jgi:hypothetical protein
MSKGWTTTLFIMVMKEIDSMESKGQLGAALAASPLLSTQSSNSYGVFRVSLVLHHEIDKGGIYIVDFRSRWFHRFQGCVKTTHEGEVGPTMWLACGPTWCPLNLALLCSSLTSSSDDLLFLEKWCVKTFWSIWRPKCPWNSKNAKIKKFALEC